MQLNTDDRLSLKDKIRQGRSVFGSFVFLSSPDVVEIMGMAGFDYVIIDLEHSPKNWSDVANMIRAAELHGMAPLIRVRENSEKSILEALELGAEGIVVPFVQSAQDVVRAAQAMNYAPLGSRGNCTLTRAARYGGLRGEFVRHTLLQNDRLVLVGQVEDKVGIENGPGILSQNPGLDIVMIGRSDLASSYGRPGEVEDPAVLAATMSLIDAAKNSARPVPSGIGLYAPSEAPKWIKAGCQFFFYSADTALMLNAAREAAAAFKAAVSESTSQK